MTDIADATNNATKWGLSASRSQKVWAVYELLIHHNLIASRIAESLQLNRSTVSRHIKKLEREQYIVHSARLADHTKRIEATSKRSVSGFSKAYIRGPRGREADITLSRIKAQVGVRAGAEAKPEYRTQPLPGGIAAMIDIHRIDINLPANLGAPNKGLPTHERTEAGWARIGVTPGKLVRGWALWSAPQIDSDIGKWNVYFRRRGKIIKNEEGEDMGLVWGEFCLPNPVRITLPDRFWVTVEEAMSNETIQSRVADAIWQVSREIQKTYGFNLGIPSSKTSQVFEAGTLRSDPELAQRLKEEREASGKGMLELADGITADGSHELLKDGFVHLDCETPQQAAMQANPTKVLDHLLKESLESMEQMRRVAEETVVTIEEHAVKSSDSITGKFENHMENLVERMMNTFEEKFNAHMEQFFTAQQDRVNRAIERFQARLEGVDPEVPETQQLLWDFFPDDEDAPEP